MKAHTRIILSFLLIGLVGLACSVTGDNSSSGETPPVATVPPAETKAPIPNSDGEGPILPFSLHFLSDMGTGGYQVWRLDRDSITQTQVTSEAVSITDFDVSPVDGRVAYLVNNQVFIVDPDGSNRTLLLDGGLVDEEDPDYHFTRKISGVRWSPDGAQLAFGRNGINVYSFSDGTNTLILPSNLEPKEGIYPYPQALYSPHTWSPDGTRLLVEIGFYESSTLGVMDAASGEVVKFDGFMACCYPNWAPDSLSVLVGSQFFGIIPAGLWRFDALTGEKLELIPHTSPDDTRNFVGWPMQKTNGELQYFFTSTTAPPAETPPLTLVSSANDGITGRVQIRQEGWDSNEALWAPDGSLVVLVEPYVQDAEPTPVGTIILIDALLEEPVRPLVVNGYQLRWGPP